MCKICFGFYCRLGYGQPNYDVPKVDMPSLKLAENTCFCANNTLANFSDKRQKENYLKVIFFLPNFTEIGKRVISTEAGIFGQF